MYIINKKSFIYCFFVLLLPLLLNVSCSDSDDDDDNVIKENKENKEAGEKFLAENLLKDNVTVTYSGLQYKIEELGTGIKPLLTDSVTLTYVGKRIDDVIFFEKTETSILANNIEGLKEGLRYMPEGSTFTLFIPYYLGFDVSERSFVQDGKTISVGAYSALIFECKLDKVVRN